MGKGAAEKRANKFNGIISNPKIRYEAAPTHQDGIWHVRQYYGDEWVGVC